MQVRIRRIWTPGPEVNVLMSTEIPEFIWRAHLPAVQGCVLCLDTLSVGVGGEDHLRLQTESELLMVLSLRTVTRGFLVLILRKQVGTALHQKLHRRGEYC